MSGTQICASEPVAVFNGCQRAYVPSEWGPNLNHLFSQALPTDLWGTEYIVTPTYGLDWEIVRFTAFENNTILSKNGAPIKTLQAFETYQDTLITTNGNYQPPYYQSTHKVACYEYSTVAERNEPMLGAPTMTPITPLNLGLDSLIFATFYPPTSTSSVPSCISNHYVNILTPTAAVSGMQMDGIDISNDFQIVPTHPTYSFAMKEVANTAHTLINTSGERGSVFSARVYGTGKARGRYEEYAYAAGFRTDHSADLLINGEYKREASICLSDSVKLKGTANFDYLSSVWDMHDPINTPRYDDTDTSLVHQFSAIGDYEVQWIITNQSIFCDNLIDDTIRATIHVLDTFHITEQYNGKPYLDLCYGTPFQLHLHGGQQVDFIADTITPQYHGQPFQVDTFYTFVDSLFSSNGCDSLVSQTIVVRIPYDTTLVRYTCDNKSPYHWETKDAYGTYTHSFTWQQGKAPLTLSADTTLRTIHGCDSLVHLQLHIQPVYFFTQDTTLCQDANTVFTWQGHNRPIWDAQRKTKINTIPLDHAGHFIYIDSLKTNTCPECEPAGCDSIYTLHLRIDSVYHYDSVYHICQNERITWQGRAFAGNKANASSKDRILPVGTYQFDTTYQTQYGCDSTFALTLHIHPTYETIEHLSICDNESPFVWQTQDHFGTYAQTLTFEPTHRFVTDTQRDTMLFFRDQLLHSQFGCDSLVHLVLTVYPTYVHRLDTAICSNDRILWEGRYFRGSDTLCIDTLHTRLGYCDSLRILNLHVQPSYEFIRHRSFCDNETIYHSDNQSVIWKPGMPLDGEYRLYFFTSAGCDSTYVYKLQGHPTYSFEAEDTICSGQWYSLHDHKEVGINTVYSVPYSVPSIDTLFIDTLSTEQYGCDSIYQVRLHINPEYRYTESFTTCQNEPFAWRGRSYDTHIAGQFTYFDSLTTALGCDSVYELQLQVNPEYYHLQIDTICANDSYLFNQIELTQSGFYYDSLQTVLGCDSVFHLYLTVLDTTAAVLYDTICYTETYDFHGKTLSQAGFYKDTTLNEWGCPHYTYLHLAQIPPTYYQLSWGDVCADEEGLTIAYNYTGHILLEYSVRFDSLGHSQGFEDIDHAPLYQADSTLFIPFPHGEVLPQPDPTYFDPFNGYTLDPKYQYLQPNRYPVSVVLHNGICGDRLQQKDTVLDVLYPSWIHEQHWNDGIVLFNETYNGGYTFSHYQWYYNGEPLVGQVREFLYLPDNLQLNQKGECRHEYQVQLTRTSDGYTTFTCPICPVEIEDSIMPQQDYFAIVPTLVVKENPVVYILSTQPGHYTIQSLTGILLDGGSFTPDSNNYGGAITLPTIGEGFSIVHLTLDNGDRRSFKILIK